MFATALGIPSMDDEFQPIHHPVLNIPEILSSIFANCNRSTNAALTRVCRTWSDRASEQLWSSLPSLLPLLRILLPLVLVDGALDFNLTATTPNWERFWALASRIRKIEHSDGRTGATTESPTKLSGRISPNVIPFLLLHQSWTSKRFLLPRLETLEWSVYWEASLLHLFHFISPALRDLIIHIDNSVPVDLATRNLERLASLPSMNIKRLCIGTHYPSQAADFQVASVVASFLKSQPTLSILDTLNLWSRGEMVHGLIQHESLQSLELHLCLDTPSELLSILDLLAHQCPHISRLIVILSAGHLEFTPFFAIKPLLSCSLVQQLQIFHPGGLYVDSDDIKIMAQAWRNMEVLNLCGCATNATPVGTPLAFLLDFAEEFSPRLRQLAVNFLCDGELPKADVVWTSFPKLEILGVGTSRLSSTAQAIAVGEFLASVCSEGTQLAHITENLWRPNAFDTINWKDSPQASHWPEVAAILESGQRLQKVASAKAIKAKDFWKS